MNFPNNIDQFKVDKDVITIIASGDSADKITPEQFEFLKKNTYVCTLNYAPCKIIGHANIFSDIKVTEFLRQHYMNKEKDHIFISRKEAFRSGSNEWEDFHKKIDYWFDTTILKAHYTLAWLLQLLQQWFPSKRVVIFGLDLKPIDDAQDIKKWYDRWIKNDQVGRGKYFPLQKKLDAFQQELIDLRRQNANFDRWCETMVVNANPDSNSILFKKVDWEYVVKEIMK